jgi:hypothetical protein
MLYDFQKYRNLSTDDLVDWKNWLNGPGLERFLDEIIELCAQYAHNSQDAAGYFLTPGPKFRKNNPALSELNTLRRYRSKSADVAANNTGGFLCLPEK